MLFETFSSQTVTANIKRVNISFNDIYFENLNKFCHETFRSWKTEEIILSAEALNSSIAVKKTKQFMDILRDLIQTYQLSSGKLMILYQAKLTRLIIVYSELNYVKCFQLYDCKLNEDTAIRLEQSITEELKDHRVGHIYFSYCNHGHHDVQTLSSYIVENFQKVIFCGLNLHSKGYYLLNTTSKMNFQIEKDSSIFLIDYLAAILHNNAQVNTSSAYLSLLSQKARKETKLKLSNISTIKILDLANNSLSDYIADDIKLILSCNNLEEVYLGRNNLQEVGMIKIAEALQANTTLKVFDISNNDISSKAVIGIAATLANKTNLEKLHLNGNKLRTRDVGEIGSKFNSSFLKVFNVSRNVIDSVAASWIAAILTKSDQLEEIYLGGNNLQVNGISIISLRLKATTFYLKVFDISDNHIGSKVTNDIVCFLIKQVKLEELILCGNDLQDGLLEIVQGLKCYSTLKILDISNNSATNRTIDCIAVFIVICFQKLQKIYLGGNNLVSVQTLQAMKYFLTLTVFDDSCTNMCTTNETTEENTVGTVSKHVVYMQMLLLTYGNIPDDGFDLSMTPQLALKHVVTKITGSGKYIVCVLV